MLTAVLNNYGLGFGLGEKGGARSFSHGGANAGFRCMLFAYRESGSGAVVMTNSDCGGMLASEVLRSIASEHGWPPGRGVYWPPDAPRRDFLPVEKAPARLATAKAVCYL